MFDTTTFDSIASVEVAVPTGQERSLRVGTRYVLAGIAKRYWFRLLFTYFLFTIENGLALLQPMCLGYAIDDLLAGRRRGLMLLVGAYVAHMIAGAARQAYDSRCFVSIYRDLATQMVSGQRTQDVAVSFVAARSALARSLVDFFEFDLPHVMHALYSLIGSLVLLTIYDSVVAFYCFTLIVPCVTINVWCQRRLSRHNRVLHDEMEREVDVISRNRLDEIREHFRRLAGSWIRISDFDTLRVTVGHLLLAGLISAALLRLSTVPNTSSGDVYVVLRYVLLFIVGVDGLPLFLRQFARFQDIASRMQHSHLELASVAESESR